MTSLAELGEISKAVGNAPAEIEGYKTGKLSSKMGSGKRGSVAYFSEEPGAKRRRMQRATYGVLGGLGGAAAVGVATKGKHLRWGKGDTALRRAWNTEIREKDFNNKYLPAMAVGGATGTIIGHKKNIESGDVRYHSKKTGKRENFGWVKPGEWKD